MTTKEEEAYEKARKVILAAAEAGHAHINLSEFGLTELPPEIGDPRLRRGLHTLNLSINQLTKLPPQVATLTALQFLILQGNALQTIPQEIYSLTNLAWLMLNLNKLQEIPSEIQRLKKLTWFTVANNPVKILPKEIGKLNRLSELDLTNTLAESLPSELKECEFLTELYLHGTPLAKLIPETLLGPSSKEVHSEPVNKAVPARPADLLDYYFNLKNSRPLNEARVLIVGRGNAGKTSVCRAMRGEAFDERQSETEGVEIQIGALQVKCPQQKGEERRISLHLWDFAGQEITYALHRFFLSTGVIYLLVLDNRDDRALEDAEDWLRTIAAYGPGSHVVVALTKQDVKRWDIAEEELLDRWGGKFGSLDFVGTDAKSRRGIDELKRKLTDIASKMEDVGALFPLEYQQAKDHFQRMKDQKEKRLTLDQFRKICREQGIRDELDDQGEAVKSAEARADGLARMLHQLGVVLHYVDDPRLKENTVLDPQWVTNGVYKLLRKLEAEGNPQLSLATARSVLPKEDREGLLFLLRLMERFEMIYPVDVPGEGAMSDEEADSRTVWLMPAVLPMNQPRLRDDSLWRQKDPDELRLRFIYPLLPEGLLPRFIVRTWPLNDEMSRWRTGTFLREGYAEALVRSVKRERTVEITVRGPELDRVRLARLIARHVEAINQDVPEKPKGEILVKVEFKGAEETVWKNISVMEKDEAAHDDGVTSVDTSAGTKRVSASEILDNFSGRKKREWENAEYTTGWAPNLEAGGSVFWRKRFGSKVEDFEKAIALKSGPTKVFLSYAHRDKRVCDVILQNLSVMEQDGLIQAWTDNMIPSGELWEEEIKRRVDEADLFVALVTTPFLASDFIKTKELPWAMKRHAEGKLKLAWVIVEPDCAWQKQDFSKLQVILPGGRAVRQWGRMQDAFNAVEKKLREMVAR